MNSNNAQILEINEFRLQNLELKSLKKSSKFKEKVNQHLIRVRSSAASSRFDESNLDDEDLKNKISTTTSTSLDESTLPPADRGFLAWRFVAIAFILEGLIWCPPLSFGVFLNYPPYTDMNPSLATSIGTVSSGILYGIGVILTPLMERNPKLMLYLPSIGTLLCCLGWLGASFSDKGWIILLFQGAIYGIGGGLLYYPVLVFVSEWWIDRRGLAGSLMFAGTSFFSLFYPLIVDWCVKNYGTSKTHRGMAVAWLIGLAPLIPFIHGRFPISSKKQNRKKMGMYFTMPLFWMLNIINFIQSLAYFVPALFLPSYASLIGTPGGITLTIFSIASFFGQIASGYLSDKYDLGCIISLTCIGSSLSIFLLWGFCKGKTMLLLFSFAYGIFSGGFSCLWHRFTMLIAPSDSNSGKLIVFFALGRGLANTLTGPISGHFLTIAGPGFGGYRLLINYCGTLMMICSAGIGIRMLQQK
ncbi:major facilitator superfamily domain-containing protein [Phakopsora pachyrhizi]|uniref:Major facilitator superfamily domain-containing protein n=1 Tax=Phakopsora pachyrhizi TaxID=170000 RepID=A0AAV0BNR9_PHAPC|nr:major facilitator superfamily domain-containing protein [Phakopsora pachyrhizi]